MRVPNIAIFVVTCILALVSGCQYVGAPIPIPVITIPLVGVTTAAISSFLASYAFWLMFAAWLLLAIATVLPRRAAARSELDHHSVADHPVAEPQPAS
jgi:membrane protein implicated in regulation of membrane protease activity